MTTTLAFALTLATLLLIAGLARTLQLAIHGGYHRGLQPIAHADRRWSDGTLPSHRYTVDD